jgi:hypothetical protein
MTVLFAMPLAVELSNALVLEVGDGPFFSSASQKIVTCLQLRKNEPSSASAAKATMKRNIAHKVKNAPFNLMGFVGSARQPMKNVHMLNCGRLPPKGMMCLSGY